MKISSIAPVLGIGLLLVLASSANFAQAAYINYYGEVVEERGTGYGNVLQLLALQQHGSADTEYGSVTWNGSNDVLSGDAANQSRTQKVEDILAEGFDETNLIVMLNLNQTGAHPALDVYDFVMRFYTSSDGSSYFDAEYNPNDPANTAFSLGLTPEGKGMGTGQAGHVFRITFEGNEGTDFFGQNEHRIGMLVSTPFDNEANAGPDDFYLGDADVNTVVPEPATLGFLLLGCAACLWRRAKK